MAEKQKFNSQFESEQRGYQSELAGKNKEIQNIQKELAIVTSSREKEREAKARELDEMQDSLRKSRSEASKFKGELSVAREELFGLNNELEKIKNELDTKIRELTEAKEKIREITSERDKSQRMVRELTDQKENVEALLHEKGFELEELNETISNNKADIKNLKAECKRSEDKIITSDKIISELKAKYTAAEMQGRKLAEENREIHAELSSKIIHLEATAAELERGKEESSELRKELSKNRSDLSSLQRQLKDSNSSVSSLERLLEKAYELLRETADRYSKLITPLLDTNLELYSERLRNFFFPERSCKDPEDLMEWLELFKRFIEIISEELEGSAQDIIILKEELARSRIHLKETDEKLRAKANEVMILKSKEKEMLNVKSDLEDRLEDYERQLIESLTEYDISI